MEQSVSVKRESQRGHHGSAERIPAQGVRAMARAALEEGLFPSVGSLARSLQQGLRSAGVSYDVRTLKRQMLGTIATVPTEVQFTILGLLPNGIRVDASAPPYVLAAKVLPLVQLWLHLNPGSSRRALASRLQRDLENDGISYTVDSLQAVLGGKNRLFVRTAIRDRLSAFLGECGFSVGGDAKGPFESLSAEISRSLAMRELVPIRRFRELCLLWIWEHHGASPRRLSTLLHEKLLQRGVQMSCDYLHRAVSGVPRRVRRLLQTVLEESLQASGIPAATRSGRRPREDGQREGETEAGHGLGAGRPHRRPSQNMA